jgi:hypothetical protein
MQLKPISSNNPCFFTQQVFLIGTYNEDGSEPYMIIESKHGHM